MWEKSAKKLTDKIMLFVSWPRSSFHIIQWRAVSSRNSVGLKVIDGKPTKYKDRLSCSAASEKKTKCLDRKHVSGEEKGMWRRK